jgi:peptidoglycan hydrolase CwlO-like protein
MLAYARSEGPRRRQDMARGIVWTAAVLMAAIALVAGCVNVDVHKSPYVVAGSPREPTPQERQRVATLDRKGLEDEVLRLTAENDSLRMMREDLNRENKDLKGERNRLKDEVEVLQNQIQEMRKR